MPVAAETLDDVQFVHATLPETELALAHCAEDSAAQQAVDSADPTSVSVVAANPAHARFGANMVASVDQPT
jgi:hypothetical protein